MSTNTPVKIDEKCNCEYPGTHDLKGWSNITVAEPAALQPHQLQGDMNPKYLPVQGKRPS